MSSGATTNIFGTISDRGTFVIDGTSSNAIVNLGSAVTLSGGGVVTLKSGSGNAFLRGNGFTLTNTADTIQGAGLIGDSGALAIVNQATIDANASGQGLNVNQGNGGVTNTGTLEATNGGTLTALQHHHQHRRRHHRERDRLSREHRRCDGHRRHAEHG